MKLVETFAQKFLDTFYRGAWAGELTPDVSKLTINESYKVQDLVAQMRTERGEEVAGYKVGCTSEAIQSQFGLHEPINGRVFRPRIYEQGIELNWKDYVNCAVEPEMVIRISKDVSGIDLSDNELIHSIDYVSPGIELHNYKFWFEPPTSQELICSGGIHAGLVVGDSRVKADKLSFENELFCVFKDDKLVTQAGASEIMGGPLHSLRWLVNFLTQRGLQLEEGSFVIPGSPVELVLIDRDTELRVDIESVGSLKARFSSI